MNGKDIIGGLETVSDSIVEEAEFGAFPARADNTVKREQSNSVFRRPLLVAAIIVLMLFLMGCAYQIISESDWFKSFFSEKAEMPLSENQKLYIEENTKEVGQSVTVDGYTLTVVSAIADSRNAYIKLILQGPPSTMLDADVYWYKNRPTTEGDGWEKNFYKVDEPDAIYGAGTWQMIDDGNPNDNSVTIMYALSQTINADLNSFEPNVTYRLHITDIEGYYGEENRSEVLAKDGVWDFDIVFDSINDDSIELISTPVLLTYNDVSVAVTSFELQTMSAKAIYSGSNNEKGIICFTDSSVVLKDGARIGISPRTFGPTGEASFVLDAPIVLSEVDYVELHDGTKILMH